MRERKRKRERERGRERDLFLSSTKTTRAFLYIVVFLPLFWSLRLDRQSMDTSFQFFFQCSINQPMSVNETLSLEGRRDDLIGDDRGCRG